MRILVTIFILPTYKHYTVTCGVALEGVREQITGSLVYGGTWGSAPESTLPEIKKLWRAKLRLKNNEEAANSVRLL